MASPEIKVRVGADLSKLDSDLKRVGNKLSKMGSQFGQIGRSISTKVTIPITLAGGAMLRTAGNFEQGMNKVRAITQASEEDFISLEKQAKQLGKTTRFSATQASEGMSFLAMAGFETNEILSAMPNVLTLASSANLDLGRSADIVSNVMQGFGQDSEQLSASVDVLTKAFVSSNTDLSQLGEAMKFVGPVANSFGIAFEEATASVGLLSDAGLQAGLAGTGLRRVLTGLSQNADELGISVFDSAGQMRPLADIIQQLEERGMTASESMELFGQRGGPALQILLERGSEALRNFTNDLSDSGGIAQSIADTQMQGFNGAMIELRSAVEGMFIAFAETGILKTFERIIDGITEKVRMLSNTSVQGRKNIMLIVGGLALLGPALMVLGGVLSMAGSVASTVGTIGTAFKSLKTPLTVMKKAMTGLRMSILGTIAPLLLKISLLGALALLGKTIFDTFEPINKFVTNLFNAIRDRVIQFVEQIVRAFNFIRNKLAEIFPKMVSKAEEGLDFLAGLGDGKGQEFADNLVANAQGAVDMVSGLLGTLGEEVQKAMSGFFGFDAMTPSGDAADIAPAQDEDEGGADIGVTPEQTAEQETLLDRIGVSVEQARMAFENMGYAISTAFANAIVEGEKLGEVLKNLLKQLANKALQKLFQVVLTGGAGGVLAEIGGGFFGKGGGLFGKLFGGIGMAQGGIVPRGFPNDSYPAMLTSGEMVVPKPHALPSLTGSAVEVFGEFRVRGSDLVTAISNTNNRTLR